MLHWIKIKFFFIVYSFFIPFFLFRKKFYYSKFICITIRLKPNGLYNFRHLYDCLTNRIYTYGEYFYFHGKVFHSSYFKYYIHVFSTKFYFFNFFCENTWMDRQRNYELYSLFNLVCDLAPFIDQISNMNDTKIL